MNEQVTGALPVRFVAAVRESVAEAALRVERALSAGRVLFYGAILVRFFLVGDTRWMTRIATAAPLVLGMVFSVVVLLAFKRPPRGERLWLGSVTVDALVAFTALLPNAVWPAPGHIGIANMPDTAAILIATAAAGLRLSPLAAVWAGLLNAGLLVGLVAVDGAVSGDRDATGSGPITMYLIWVLGCALVAVILAVTIRRVVMRGAETAVRMERAERGLWTVLAEHHDLRSMLSAVTIRADLLAETVASQASGPEVLRIREQAGQIRDGLARIRQTVEEVRGRTVGDLSETRPVEAVELAPAIERVAGQVRLRFPSVALEVGTIPAGAAVAVAGGESSLDRILLNLLQNACEGDGSAVPSSVVVGLETDVRPGMLRVAIRDDGPGPPSGDGPGVGPAASTKPGGTGVGLPVARGLVEASGGTLTLIRRDPSGTTASFALPQAAAR